MTLHPEITGIHIHCTFSMVQHVCEGEIAAEELEMQVIYVAIVRSKMPR
jgi:hypothetical protein